MAGNGRRALTRDDIPEIRRLYRAGSSCALIAGQYGVTTGAILAVVNGTNWRAVPDPLGPVARRNKGARPERAARVKLDWDRVREIRERYGPKMGCYRLAKQYGVSPTTVWEIVTGKTWHELPDTD